MNIPLSYQCDQNCQRHLEFQVMFYYSLPGGNRRLVEKLLAQDISNEVGV